MGAMADFSDGGRYENLMEPTDCPPQLAFTLTIRLVPEPGGTLNWMPYVLPETIRSWVTSVTGMVPMKTCGASEKSARAHTNAFRPVCGHRTRQASTRASDADAVTLVA